MKIHPKIRTVVIAIVTAIAILVIGWWGAWSLAAAQYRHVINGWVESGRADGYQISYDEEKLFGFPRHIVMRYTNVQWKNTDNILFHADDIDIAALPWRWNVFDAKFKHRVQITAPIDAEGHALVLGGEDGRAHVDLDKDGFWHLSRVSLTNATFGQTPNYVATASMLKAEAERPAEPPKDNKDAGLTVEAEAQNVVIPQGIPTPFGQQMADFAVNVRIMGQVPDFRRRDSTAAWNTTSGVVEFSNLHFDWGPLKLTARGTMGFDDDLQPEGAFAGSISDHNAVLKALLDGGYIPKHEESMLNSALSLFAKPSKFGDAAGIEIPIAVQLGGLFLGPVKIFSFPSIEWPSDAKPETTPPATVPEAVPETPAP